jgi:hypothetical protein
MNEVTSCSYRDGRTLTRWDGTGLHHFPIVVQSDGGELLLQATKQQLRSNSAAADAETSRHQNEFRLYDTLISINVLEHVQVSSLRCMLDLTFFRICIFSFFLSFFLPDCCINVQLRIVFSINKY